MDGWWVGGGVINNEWQMDGWMVNVTVDLFLPRTR